MYMFVKLLAILAYLIIKRREVIEIKCFAQGHNVASTDHNIDQESNLKLNYEAKPYNNSPLRPYNV